MSEELNLGHTLQQSQQLVKYWHERWYESELEIRRLQSQLDEINQDGAGLLKENHRMRDKIIELQSEHGLRADAEKLAEALENHRKSWHEDDHNWSAVGLPCSVECEKLCAALAEFRKRWPK